VINRLSAQPNTVYFAARARQRADAALDFHQLLAQGSGQDYFTSLCEHTRQANTSAADYPP